MFKKLLKGVTAAGLGVVAVSACSTTNDVQPAPVTVTPTPAQPITVTPSTASGTAIVVPPPTTNNTTITVEPQSTNNYVDKNGEFKPVGHVQGAVIDAITAQPIEGAIVVLNAAGKATSVTTAKDGTFGFAGIPATKNGGKFAVAGAYAITVEIPEGKGYRRFTRAQGALYFNDLGDGTAGTGTQAAGDGDPNNSTPVHHLTSEPVWVPVFKVDGVVSGTAFDSVFVGSAPQPVELGLFYNGSAVSFSSNPGGSSTGGFLPFENGMLAATVTTGADGKFTFPAVESGVRYKLRPTDPQMIIVDVNGAQQAAGLDVTVQPGKPTKIADFALFRQKIVDPDVPFITESSPADVAVLPKAGATGVKVTFKFNEKMDTKRDANRAVSKFILVSGRNNSTQNCLNVDYTAKWADDTTLEVTPRGGNLQPGYDYRVDLNNAFLADANGKLRTGVKVRESNNTDDAIAVNQVDSNSKIGGLAGNCVRGVGAKDTLFFSISEDEREIPLVQLKQEDLTADSTGDAVETSADGYRRRRQSGYYTHNTADAAYVYWDVTSTTGVSPYANVSGWAVYARQRKGALAVNLTPTSGACAGATLSGTPLFAERTSLSVKVDTVNKALQCATQGGDPAFPTWNPANFSNNLTFDIGIFPVNKNGEITTSIENDANWITVRDNTPPRLKKVNTSVVVEWPKPGDANRTAKANDYDFYGTGAFVGGGTKADQAGVSTHMTFPATDRAESEPTGMKVANFGEGIFTIALTEPVLSSSVTTANVKLVSGTLQVIGQTGDPNSGANAAETEADATIVAAMPFAPGGKISGGAELIGTAQAVSIKVNNMYLLDTGDKFVINNLQDAASNKPATDAFMVELVDDVPPGIQKVEIDGATNKLTVTFTEKLKYDSAKDGRDTTNNKVTGNLWYNKFDLSSLFPAGFPTAALLANSGLGGPTILKDVTHSYVGGVSQVVMTFDDVSWFKNDGRLQAGTNNTMGNLDGKFCDVEARGTSGTTNCLGGAGNKIDMGDGDDSGSRHPLTYFLYKDFTDLKGAYVNGTGKDATQNALKDKVGPRLSNVLAHRKESATGIVAANNTGNIANAASFTFTLRVCTTERACGADADCAAGSEATQTDTLMNPDKWSFTFNKLGADFAWGGSGANADAAAAAGDLTRGAVTVAYNAAGHGNGFCNDRQYYQISVPVTNASGANNAFGIATMVASSDAKDDQGNQAGVMRTYEYQLSNIPDDPTPTQPGFVRK
ncbi:MAG: hypothetical protein GMKNLPBB_00662 [Myxococcota bacterium]|nr:hypothetical protein [Myxococcota bacterium]